MENKFVYNNIFYGSFLLIFYNLLIVYLNCLFKLINNSVFKGITLFLN